MDDISSTLVFESPESIKSIEIKDGKATVGAYAIRFSGPDQKDLSGEFFTAKTYLGAHKGDGVDVLFLHGIPELAPSQAISKSFAGACNLVMGAAKSSVDAVGVFVQHVLDLSNEYEAAIAQLCSAGKLKWSSAATAHMVKKSSAGEIIRWPIAEFSYTPTPAEPRLPAISALKSVELTEKETTELGDAFTAAKTKTPDPAPAPDPVPDPAPAPTPDPAPVDNPPKPKAALQKKSFMENIDPEIQKRIDDEVAARVAEIKSAQEKVDESVKARTAEIQEIYAIGDKFAKRGEAAKFVEEGKSIGDFQSFILSRLNPKTFQLDPSAADLKTMRRKDFDALTVGDRNAFLKGGGKLTD